MSTNISKTISTTLRNLGLKTTNPGVLHSHWSGGKEIEVHTPIDGSAIAKVAVGTPDDVERAVNVAKEAQLAWRSLPPPSRGIILRDMRKGLLAKRNDLATLMTLEVGKTFSESLGEVDEFINILDYANGLSRILPSKIAPSELCGPMMMEKWNPFGLVGIITAFNYPTSVYGWNAAPALVTGNATIWKPSETTTLTGIAVAKVMGDVIEYHGMSPALVSIVCGGVDVGKALCENKHVSLVSFTGSTDVGKDISRTVGNRFGQTLLELGGNNAVIVDADADFELAVRTVAISALETNGQRCTSPRRLFLQRLIADKFIERLTEIYKIVRIGNPLNNEVFLGPLHSVKAVEGFRACIQQAKLQGGELIYGGQVIGGRYVEPTLCRISASAEICQHEAFVPILYIHIFDSLGDAIQLANGVQQGLSAALWTRDLSKAIEWIGPEGSDCGVVNVNQSTHWAEISTSFGGNKCTGWGREGGGEAWKNFVRWSMVTINACH